MAQQKYFEEEIAKDDVIGLCLDDKNGFIIGKIITPPEVYDAGLTIMIEDFCVKSPDLWQDVGAKLLDEIIRAAKRRDVKQIVVVCGNHDFKKSGFLEKITFQLLVGFIPKIFKIPQCI